jgi:hypothetical protein
MDPAMRSPTRSSTQTRSVCPWCKIFVSCFCQTFLGEVPVHRYRTLPGTVPFHPAENLQEAYKKGEFLREIFTWKRNMFVEKLKLEFFCTHIENWSSFAVTLKTGVLLHSR